MTKPSMVYRRDYKPKTFWNGIIVDADFATEMRRPRGMPPALRNDSSRSKREWRAVLADTAWWAINLALWSWIALIVVDHM